MAMTTHSIWQRGVPYTTHARRRMQQRALTQVVVEQTMIYGREVIGHDTVLYVVGRNEVAEWRREGLRVEHLEGVHVVCSSAGEVITAYRNRTLAGFRALRHAA
jgi:hypothetical protein